MGEAAESPTDVSAGGWKDVFKRAFADFRANDLTTTAAGLTYYAVLSLFPALLAFVALLGVAGQYTQTSDAVLRVVGEIGPQSAVDTLRGTIEGVVKDSGLGSSAVDVWAYAKFPVLAVIVVLMIALLYRVAPNVEQPGFKWLTPGGAVGLLTLLVASALFGVYVANFGSYNKTFGTLAFVPLFLTWLWIANLALLFGAAVDAERARSRQIEAGMRPVDTEPFLPVRDDPDPPKDGAALAREELSSATSTREE